MKCLESASTRGTELHLVAVYVSIFPIRSIGHGTAASGRTFTTERRHRPGIPARAERLKEYCQDRLGDGLRAVGYHSGESVEVVYIRDDISQQYTPEDVDNFIGSSRRIHSDLHGMDRRMGTPEASLHLLEDGLIVQFHYGGEDVIFLSIDRGVGRNFTEFIDDCRDAME